MNIDAENIPPLDEEINRVVGVGRLIEGEGFDDMNATDVQEVLEVQPRELTEEELEQVLQESDNDSDAEETPEDSQKSSLTL